MGKTAKIYVKRRQGSLAELCADSILEADKNDLAVLSVLLLSADDESKATVSPAELSAMLDMTEESVGAAIKFWRGAGILSSVAPKNASENNVKISRSAHRDGVLETNPEIDYNTEALVGLLEKKKVTSEFIDEAQRIFGKTFNAYDSNIAAGLIERLGFEPEAVLAILAYCSERGKKTMRYAEKLAISFYDEDITTSDAVYDKIRKIEKNAIVIEQIKKLFGVGERALSSTEKKLFEHWINDYGYDIEIIRRAYDITIDNAHEPEPKYTNGVLTKWYEAGIKMPEDIDKYEEQRKTEYSSQPQKTTRARKKSEPEREKSYDIDAFFEASLARGFEESDKNT